MMKQVRPQRFGDRFRRRFILALFICTGLFVAVVAWLLYLSKDLPSLDELERYDPDLITKVISADDVVIQELFTTQRTLVKSNEIPNHVKKALVITEDQQFYDHWGMNVFRTFYNITLNLVTGEIHGGASSLTQQLARSLYKRIGFKQTYTRKLRELITAIQIEHTYTKPEILTMYLNTVYFGHGTYGIQAAAQKYFGKQVENLTLDEGALLVGMLRAPAPYSPLVHPDRALHIRNVVIQSMFREKAINAVERNYYKALPLVTAEPDSVEEGLLAPYFGEFVRQQLEKEDEQLGVDLYRDGLTIYTTLDSRMQRIANEVLSKELERRQGIFEERLKNPNVTELSTILSRLGSPWSEDTVRLWLMDSLVVDTLYPDSSVWDSLALDSLALDSLLADSTVLDTLEMPEQLRHQLTVQGQIIALDVRTGQIRAMVGGRDFSKSKWNRSTQMNRQPGSSFKAFLYTAVIDNGYPVTIKILNQPVVIKFGHDSLDWRPKNYDLSMGGETTLREGIRRSLNLVAVRMIQELVAPAAVVEKARAMGITSPLYPGDALALGSSAVIPVEMAAAFAVFPRLGIWIEPTGITSIQDRYGGTIKTYEAEQREVLGRATSYIMLSMLETVANQGTGRYARSIYGFKAPAGGKTGTTTDFTDAWYVGFTNELAVAVWIGMDAPAIRLGPRQSGAVVALPVWAQFMKAVYDEMEWEGTPFEVPEEAIKFVNVCSETHKLATEYCTPLREVFKPGTEPTERCDVHGTSRRPTVIDF